VTQPVLVLAWLVLAHMVADFGLQTAGIVRAKSRDGRAALGGLATHGLVVAICLIPAGLAFGGGGWLFVAWSALLHVVIDRSKVLLTRRAATRALADAGRRHEGPQPADHLGRAWTPVPATLFVLDQLAHLAVLGAGWAMFLSASTIQPGWSAAVDTLLGGLDRGGVHDVVAVGVVLASLAFVNLRAASIFVGILVRPVEEAEGGEVHWGSRSSPATAATPSMVIDGPPPPRRWSIRLGPFETRVEAEALDPVRARDAVGSAPSVPHTARVGATIGILERILVVIFVLTGTEAAIGFVVAAKTLARFRLLDDRDFAEYYLLGTLASVAVAIVTGLVGRAALSALLA